MLSELTLVALPIGNVEDISARAIKTLKKVDGVLAEDTRKFKDFCRMAGLELAAEIKSFDSYAEREGEIAKLFEKLKGHWALVSDAGTPGINDPGAQLVKWARHHHVKVSALPGPSALTLALQLSGAFGNPIIFLGFSPKKCKASFFENHSNAKTIVFFETKHNVLHTLQELSESKFKNSKLICLREMTKSHEDYFEGNILDHLQYFKNKIEEDKVGELSFVLEGPGESHSADTNVLPEDLVAFREAPPSQAAKILSKLCRLSRDEAYNLLKSS